MRLALALALLAAPLAAEPTAAQRIEVNLAWEAARTEFGRFLTCSRLMDRRSWEGIERGWTNSVSGAAAVMSEAGYAQGDIDAQTALSSVDALRLPGDTPFAEVIAYCEADPEWLITLQRLAFTRLDRELEQILR